MHRNDTKQRDLHVCAGGNQASMRVRLGFRRIGSAHAQRGVGWSHITPPENCTCVMKSSAGSSRSISTSYLFLSHLTFTATDGIVLKRFVCVDYSREEKNPASAERAGQRMQRAPQNRKHVISLGLALDTSFRARGGFLSERARKGTAHTQPLPAAPCNTRLAAPIGVVSAAGTLRALRPNSIHAEAAHAKRRADAQHCSGQFRSRPTH
jgi:hypothetical protein